MFTMFVDVQREQTHVTVIADTPDSMAAAVDKVRILTMEAVRVFGRGKLVVNVDGGHDHIVADALRQAFGHGGGVKVVTA